ncbi:MAG: universal stress protein [Cyclobacteriaceae bacterium]
MKHILCPLDFSETSLNALEFAVSIAKKHEADLSLVYVFTEEYYNKHLTEGVKSYQEYENEFKSRLEVIEREIQSKKFSTASYVLGGRFVPSIKNFLKIKKTDLLVTGTKGVSDVLDRMVGSNTINMLDNLDVPVLAVPKKASFEGIDNIVYATSYKEEDKIILSKIVEFAKPFGSDITVLHLSKRDNIIEEALLKNFKDKLSGYVDCSNIHFQKSTYSENLAMGIDQYMMREKSTVLSLLMEKRNLIDRLFHKSITKELSYLMDFPLLVFKNKSL